MYKTHRLARALGWFSVGLGLTELLGGEQLDETFGTRDRRNLFRAFGLRELITGVGILLPGRPTAPWLWARVAGDVLDLAALGESTRLKRARRDNLAAAIIAVTGVTAVDVFCAWQLTGKGSSDRDEAGAEDDQPHVKRSLTVDAPANTVRRLWEEGGTFSQIMGHLAEVHPTGEGRARWTTHGPLGETLTWDTEMVTTTAVANGSADSLCWRSLSGAKVPNEITLRLRPAPVGQGTEMHLGLRFEPPGGALGKGVAKLFGALPGVLAMKALARAKALLEAGEIPALGRNASARTGATANAY